MHTPEKAAAAQSVWRDEDATWIFQDPVSQALRETLDQVAPSEAGVLLLGDGGADKDMVARYIHANSPRRNGPFVSVNCGALTENMIHAELFGHAQGAFAGAFDSAPGRLEEAHLGTLFLDEVDDLPLAMQSKLVRVLQEKMLSRMGSQQRIAVDVRVVAASAKSLEQAVALRKFREDLYYLLGVVRLTVPALRQRPGDIIALAEHFIRVWCQRMHYAPVVLNAQAEQKLLEHDWPGNSRELENVIQRTLLLSRGLHIGANDLLLLDGPERVTVFTEPAQEEDSHARAVADLALDEALESLCDVYDSSIEQHVLNALLLKVWQRNRCNQVQTAKQLGISRSVVRARLQRLGQTSLAARNGEHEDSGEVVPHLPAQDAPEEVKDLT
ncbi:sigma-54-dependent Fis family transcriptional regulator [Lampropedia puyangensis]|uniref:Sigma-54-dependent Fis family transcriptional regulator n=2 Tax=Lampropedia puyangensis TaxID=1330072 RepID=A0A4S8F5A9_9BURK|nr:sigma-54-dependent Fis family transcriptional regulator [Lampropedia puyangensis]